jgi:hypothetical protein
MYIIKVNPKGKDAKIAALFTEILEFTKAATVAELHKYLKDQKIEIDGHPMTYIYQPAEVEAFQHISLIMGHVLVGEIYKSSLVSEEFSKTIFDTVSAN